MEQSDLLKYVADVLERLQLPYFVTGSIASSYFGEPRFTNDIDVVVDLPLGRVGEFIREFPPGDFYVSEDAARQAIRSRGQFNIIHPESGLKVDVMIPAGTPFDKSRFARALRGSPNGSYEVTLASMEDVILKKMEYYHEGGSEKHLRDITSILRLNPTADRAYIGRWASDLGIEEVWQAIESRLRTN